MFSGSGCASVIDLEDAGRVYFPPFVPGTEPEFTMTVSVTLTFALAEGADGETWTLVLRPEDGFVACLTLADGLRRVGATCRFICRAHEGALIGFLRERGYDVSVLPI